ncbi:MAG TPA: ABC transporter permease [Bryobacteraceae bacterium]|nr:ABC transporter permease [Bryobacteraceae bacterium]
MKAMRRLFRRLFSWLDTHRDEDRLQSEIEEHIALQTADNIRAGLSPFEARREAVLKFGSVEATKENYRDQRGMPSIETLIQDTRHALRRLRLAPAFTMATILTLSLGVGATTAIFTLVNAVLMKSLPVAKPEELYRLGKEVHCCYTGGYSQEHEFSMVSYQLYEYLRDHTKGFAELAAFPSLQLLFGVRRAGTPDGAQSYPGEFVSGNYFAMFGIRPYAGRMLTPDDDRPGAPLTAVISYRLWQQKYAADSSVIGATFNVNDKPLTIVGVTPPGFFGDTLRSTPPDFFLPLNTEPVVESDSDLMKYDTHWLDLIGRLQPGVAPASVEAEMRVELKQWLRSHWGEMSPADRLRFPAQTLFLSPGGAGITSMRGQYQHWLLSLMTVTGFVLLIACANVASLMLVRGMERRPQISLSMALGARLSRIIREPLLESVLLSLAGGAAGVGVAFVGTRLILRLAFPALPGSANVPIDASPSLPVLLFAFTTSLLTGIAFGLAPSWMATRVDPIEALRGASRTTARAGMLPRKTLVVLQSALSLVLLSAAGLLTSAFQNLENQNFGFEQDRRVVASINPRLAGYRAPQLAQLYTRIHDAVTAIPGVSGAALCLYSPPNGGWGTGVFIDGHPRPAPGDELTSSWNRVSAGYFDVIGTPILRGRGVTDQDTAASRKVAVISESFARKFFSKEDPVGKHFGRTAEESREFEIVGIAKDARYLTRTLDEPTGPIFFIPVTQADYSQTNLGSLFLHDIVVVSRPGTNVAEASIRQAVSAVDPGLPIITIHTFREQVSILFTQPRLIARLTSLFGVLSLLLASIGLYGVTAYNAGRRTGEIGVRIALGANRGQVTQLVLRGAFALIVFGVAIGLPLSLAAGRFLGNQLYGTSPYNLLVTLSAIAALGVSALVASLVPALRASRLSPQDALRTM